MTTWKWWWDSRSLLRVHGDVTGELHSGGDGTLQSGINSGPVGHLDFPQTCLSTIILLGNSQPARHLHSSQSIYSAFILRGG